MPEEIKYITLSMDVCFHCGSNPVHFSNWTGKHGVLGDHCMGCKNDGIDSPLMQIAIKIPASLFNDKAYSPYLVSRWADTKKFL